MDERQRNQPTTLTDVTRRGLLTALTGGAMTLLGLGVTISQSEAKRTNKMNAQRGTLPRPW